MTASSHVSCSCGVGSGHVTGGVGSDHVPGGGGVRPGQRGPGFYDSLVSCELQLGGGVKLGGGVRPGQRGPGNSLLCELQLGAGSDHWGWGQTCMLQLGGGVILHFYLDAGTLAQLLMLMPVGMVRAVASERRTTTAKAETPEI